MPLPTRPWCGIMDPGRRVETVEDRHVMAKHRLVCLSIYYFLNNFFTISVTELLLLSTYLCIHRAVWLLISRWSILVLFGM